MAGAHRVLFFDVFGTLVDWRASLIDSAAATGVAADWPAVVDDWRREYRPALDRVRAGRTWRDLDAVHRETLHEVLQRHHVDLPAPDREALVQSWRLLRPWPDSRPGLDRLRARFTTATLSNGHLALLVDLLRFGDLRVDAVLSAQLVDSYKPEPRVYLRAAELLECEPSRAAMVAAHASDLEAAAALGMRPVLVRRPYEWGETPVERSPEGLPGLLVVDSLTELADVLR